MTNEKRQRLEAVVRALMAKTTAAGATEGEAMAAAEKARELIDRYQLELGADEVLQEGMERYQVDVTGFYERAFYQWASLNLSRYCEVKLYRDMNVPGVAVTRYVVVGLASDVEFFKFLSVHLLNHATFGARVYGANFSGRDKYRQRVNFIKGCAERISHRLQDLIRERQARAHTGQQALVPIDKASAIAAYLRDQGVNLRKGRAAVKHWTGEAGLAGRAHGDKATFGRPVGGNGGPVALIGRK